MARPKVPLIAKRKALEVALDIVDNEGIDSLSIRRLAERLNVNGASLYHHFENKEEIVVGAAKLALEEVRTPQTRDEPWQIWIMRNARQLRQALREHPDLIPVMLRREPLGIGVVQLDATVVLLEREGVPIGAIAPLITALELFAIGSALHEARAEGTSTGKDIDPVRTPNLGRALELASVSADDIFDLVCRQIIDGVLAAATDKPSPQPAASDTSTEPAPA